MSSGGEFEVKPRRDAVEKVLSRLSIKTLMPANSGSGGQVELTATEFAGMLARLGQRNGVDRLARATAERLAFAYLEHGSALEELIDHLDTWGRARVLFRNPDVTISGRQHTEIVSVLTQRHVYGRWATVHDLRTRLKVGHRRWQELTGPVGALVRELNRADMVLHDHLTEELGGRPVRSVPDSEQIRVEEKSL